MPELPEVETVARGLAPNLVGRRITVLTLRRADLRHPFPADLVARLEGARIVSLGRRAKYLLMGLETGDTALVHLGMSGRMLLHAARPNRMEKHDHLVMELEDGQVLVFNDARRFGLWAVTRTEALAEHPLLAHLGPEPLGEGFTPEVLAAGLTRRKGPIKPALMDQTLVVGVGNIYASEALFRLGIHPAKPANSLTKKQISGLVPAIRAVLTEAIESGGSTLRDYVRSSGELGYFQHRFNVYGRTGEPCPVCTTPIEQITQAGRSSFFCPRCQPMQPTKTLGKPRAAGKLPRRTKRHTNPLDLPPVDD